MASQLAVAEGLFTRGPEPRLIGGRNRESGGIVFPCPADPGRYEPVELSRRGTLWSWTVQRFRPKTPPYIGPEAFEPFAVGYVELPGEVIVEARLTGIAFDALRIGMDMEMTLIPFATDARGDAILTYAFAPAGQGGA